MSNLKNSNLTSTNSWSSFLMSQNAQLCHPIRKQLHPRPAHSSEGSRNLPKWWSPRLGHGAVLANSKPLLVSKYVITTRAREGGPKEHSAKQKWPGETHLVTNVPGLCTLSDLSRIVTKPPPSFLCCLRPPSHHPSSLTSVPLVAVLH